MKHFAIEFARKIRHLGTPVVTVTHQNRAIAQVSIFSIQKSDNSLILR